MVFIAHTGDSNFHTRISFDSAEEGQCKEAERLNNFMFEITLAMEGTCTGEHGVGTTKLKVSISIHRLHLELLDNHHSFALWLINPTSKAQTNVEHV